MPPAPPNPPRSIRRGALTDFRRTRRQGGRRHRRRPYHVARSRGAARCSKPESTCWWKSPSRRIWHRPAAWSTPPQRHGRILQVGHLERFNPAVMELERRATLPLFFEIHRLNVFSPRSLDVDVVLDLMIHDVDIVLALAKAEPQEIRAAGISHSLPKGGYRQRAAAVSQRLRGQSHGQPGLHRAGPQAAPVPAAANICRWITAARIC